MELPKLKKFNELIDKNTHCYTLYNEIQDDESLGQPNKVLKLSQAHELAKNIFIDQLLEECTSQNGDIKNITEKMLHEQLANIILLYKNSSSYNLEKMKTVTFMKTLLTNNLISIAHFSKMLSQSEMDHLPLDILWYLFEMQIISLDQVIIRFIENRTNGSQLLDDILSLILKNMEDDNAKIILRNVYVVLITLSYELKDEYDSLQRGSNKLLQELLHKFLETATVSNPQSMEIQEENDTKNFINIFDLLIHHESLTPDSLCEFLSNQLINILTYKPEVSLSFVIQQQCSWRSTNSSKVLTSIFFSIIKGLGYEEAFKIMNEVVTSFEINWSYILTFLSSLLLANHESAAKLKGFIDSYIRNGCSTNKTEYLVLGFLFARHASMEGRHVFPSYSHWFVATFGSENSSPANNRQSFLILFRFLTDLVPYESVAILRTHIHQSIFVPKGCHNILKDYQQLARIQLEELNKNTPAPSNGEKNSFPQSQLYQSNADSDVKSAISLFEESGKVPSFILEASIFKRPYYLSSFLPSLLTARHLPDCPDVRMKLVDSLFSVGKIPEKMYRSYIDECKNISSNSSLTVDDNPNSDIKQNALEILEEYLKKFINLEMSGTYDEASTEAMIILSQLTNCVEELTAKHDYTLKDASSLTIPCAEYDSHAVNNQVLTKIFDAIEKLVAVWRSRLVHERISQLVALLATSPSLQLAMMTSLLRYFSILQEENGTPTEKLQFVGVVICELKFRDNLFLPMRLSSTAEKEFLTPADLFIKKLCFDSVKNIYLSCRILSAVVETHSKIKRINETLSEEAKMKDVHILYCCVAARLCVMHLEGVNDISYYPVTQANITQIAFIAELRVPMCCSFFVEKFRELEKVPFTSWLNFELETPWCGTPLPVRIRYLHFWFLSHCSSSNQHSSEERTGDRFLVLFWSLVDIGIMKENAGDLFILLQSVAFTDCEILSLLEEWVNWKKNFNTNSGDNEESVNRPTYHAKLVVFMRLCCSLPPSMFTGKTPSVSVFIYLPKLVHDILEMECELLLAVQETRFFLECFLFACQQLDPQSALVQKCFSSLSSSVLFHFTLVNDIGKKYSSVIEKYPCLQYLKFRTEDEIFRSSSLIPDINIGVVVSSLLSRGKNFDFDSHSLPAQKSTVIFIFSAAFFGQRLMQRSSKSNETGYNDLWYPVVPAELSRMEVFISSLVDSVIGGGVWSDPMISMAGWKKEAASNPSPLFYKAFLVGLIYILLNFLEKQCVNETDYNGEVFARLFSLLLLSFTTMVKFYEKHPDITSPSLSHLSSLICRIYYLVDSISDRPKPMISDSVLRCCDKDLVAAIGHKGLKPAS